MINRDHSSQTTILLKLKDLLKIVSKPGSSHFNSKVYEDSYWYHIETVESSIGSGEMRVGTRLVRITQLTKVPNTDQASENELMTILFLYRNEVISSYLISMDGMSMDGKRVSQIPEYLGSRVEQLLNNVLYQKWTMD